MEERCDTLRSIILAPLFSLSRRGRARARAAATAAPTAEPARLPTRRASSVKGSDTMVILGPALGRDVHEGRTRASPIQVTGGGSGTGIAALINGTTDICESSRPMKDNEKADVQSEARALPSSRRRSRSTRSPST